MDESIELPVLVKGEIIYYTAKVLAFGYVYKLSVDINGVEVLFERDEQGNFRAVLARIDNEVKIDAEIITGIMDVLNSAGA